MSDPTSTFFDGLLGIHDFQVNGGSLLARRNTVDITGGRVESVGGVTQISVGTAPVWLPTIVITANEDDVTADGWAAASDIAFDPTGADRTITGFDATSLTVQRKRLWNFTTDARDFIIAHQDSGSLAVNRVITPDQQPLTVTATDTVVLVRTADNLNWRAYLGV